MAIGEVNRNVNGFFLVKFHIEINASVDSKNLSFHRLRNMLSNSNALNCSFMFSSLSRLVDDSNHFIFPWIIFQIKWIIHNSNKMNLMSQQKLWISFRSNVREVNFKTPDRVFPATHSQFSWLIAFCQFVCSYILERFHFFNEILNRLVQNIEHLWMPTEIGRIDINSHSYCYAISNK